MPKLSDTMTVGTVIKWHKQVGEEVANGDILAEIETDKATMELENFEDGVLLQLFAEEGDEVAIGKALAVVGNLGDEVPLIEESDDTNSDESSDVAPAKDQPNFDELVSVTEPVISSENADQGTPETSRLRVSPLARKIASEQGIDLSKIKGTGPGGRIIKKDLAGDHELVLDDPDGLESMLQIQASPSSSRLNSTLVDKSIPVSKMRSVIARRLLESKSTIPHFYLQKEINSEPMRLARESINRRLAGNTTTPVKISINDIILLSCSRAIQQVPEINTSWADKEIIFHGNVNLAFGVAVDDGLVTPVIKKAESLDLCSLSAEAKSLIEKSRSKKLTPEEMSGSTFTVTNLGMFGIDFFSGIINPPNAAILAVGSSVSKPIVGKDGSVRSGETMILGLSCDHRLVDGAVGARFLQALAEILEQPACLLV